MICEEKDRLIMQWVTAIEDLREAQLKKLGGKARDAARKACEAAREAFGSHRAEHGTPHDSLQ